MEDDSWVGHEKPHWTTAEERRRLERKMGNIGIDGNSIVKAVRMAAREYWSQQINIEHELQAAWASAGLSTAFPDDNESPYIFDDNSEI